MNRIRYVKEVELKASPSMLFPYFSTPSGLSEWFADEVSSEDEKEYQFTWNGVPSFAKKISQKAGKYITFQFSPETEEEMEEPSFIEFTFQYNDLTNSTFVQVTDFSDSDKGDLEEMWNNCIESLMEIIGRN